MKKTFVVKVDAPVPVEAAFCGDDGPVDSLGLERHAPAEDLVVDANESEIPERLTIAAVPGG